MKKNMGIVSREYYQTDETCWYEDKKKWKGLVTFGMVKKLEKPDGRTTEEKRYYISSLPVDVELFSKAARGHWGVENRILNIDHQLQRTANMKLVIESAKTNTDTRKIPMT